jgi:hypothetical protein
MAQNVQEQSSASLTKSMKRGTVKSRGCSMSKYFTAGIGLTLFMLTLIPACAPAPALTDQIAFGIWAAEKDLWEEAIFRWKKVLAENPDSVGAHNNLAVGGSAPGVSDRFETGAAEFLGQVQL